MRHPCLGQECANGCASRVTVRSADVAPRDAETIRLGMGDSDKPNDYAYSTAERTDLVIQSGVISPSSPRCWLPSTFPRLSIRGICDPGLSAPSGVNPRAGRTYAAFSR